MRIPKLILLVVASALLLAAASADDKAPTSKVQELQKERVATLKTLVELSVKLSQSGQGSLDEVLDARLQLIEAQLAVADSEADRIALLKLNVEAFQQSEALARAMAQAGQGTQAGVLKAKARRLEAEIRLDQEQTKLAAGREQPAEARPAKIVVASPETKDVDITRQYVGQIQAGRHIEVHSQLSGYLEEVLVKEGQAVERGEVLFKLASQLYRPKVDVEMAEVALATIAYKNSERLFQSNVVSTNELALSKAKLAGAEAKAKLAQAELDLTIIRAPFSGYVGRIARQPGSLVTERDTLTTLSDNSTVWADFNVPESDFGFLLGENQKAELRLANGSKYAEPGKIAPVTDQVDSQSGTISCRAAFPNAEGKLRHGMNATVLIHQPLRNAIVIPQQATFELAGKRYVYIVDEDNRVHQRAVVIGHEVDDSFVIKQGLDAKDRIMVQGIRQLRDGEKLPSGEKHTE